MTGQHYSNWVTERTKTLNIGKISQYAIYTWRWVCPHNANILTSSSRSLSSTLFPALSSTLIVLPMVLPISCEALSDTTSAVTLSFSGDLKMTSGLRRPHPDKAPRAFVSALSAASLYNPKATQRDEPHWPLPHPGVPASQRLNAQCILQLAAYSFHTSTASSFRRTFVNTCAQM